VRCGRRVLLVIDRKIARIIGVAARLGSEHSSLFAVYLGKIRALCSSEGGLHEPKRIETRAGIESVGDGLLLHVELDRACSARAA